jgi:hypothetical protein
MVKAMPRQPYPRERHRTRELHWKVKGTCTTLEQTMRARKEAEVQLYTSTLIGRGCGQRHISVAILPEKDQLPIVQKSG